MQEPEVFYSEPRDEVKFRDVLLQRMELQQRPE